MEMQNLFHVKNDLAVFVVVVVFKKFLYHNYRLELSEKGQENHFWAVLEVVACKWARASRGCVRWQLV